MMAPCTGAAESAGAAIASACPRISTQRTRHGSTEAMSSTTNAARPLSATFRNLRLAVMLNPPMSIVPVAGLYRNPTGLAWSVPSGCMVASRPSRCPAR